MLGLLATFNSLHSSPSLAFWAAMAWAGDCTVCDWRNEMREAFVDVFAPPLLMIGLFGGIGGGTRADEATNCPFFIGGCGAVACCTLWARMIVATLEPLVIALELSWRSTWPGDIDRAIPVAKSEQNFITEISNSSWSDSLGPDTGTLETVAVGWMTFDTLLIIGFAPDPKADFLSASFSMRSRTISASRSLTL